MGVRHEASAAKPLLTSRRVSPAPTAFAVALVVLLSCAGFAATDSDSEAPWLAVAALAGGLILVGVVRAVLTIWRTEEREPYWLR